MRSLLIVFGAIALLGGGFFIYYSLQTPSHRGSGMAHDATPAVDARAAAPTTASVATMPPPPREGEDVAGPAGPGNDVWVQSLDDKMRVAFQFRASRYDPTKEGPVGVTNPQAEVFIGDEVRQVVRIEGKTGRVVMPSDAARRSSIRGNETSAPRRGELKDVTISLFDEADTAHALLVCRVNNVTFDNDTFRIATEAYTDAAGRDVPADEVRVEVRGDDFDFDGRGLTIQWNEADRRLQLLEIAHGERLTIKSPEMLHALDRTTGAKPEPQHRTRADGDAAAVLASAKQPAPAGASVRKPTSKPTSSAPLYRATFRDAVRVTRGGAALASADQMLVDFINDRSEPVSTSRAPKRDVASDAAKADRPRDLTRGNSAAQRAPAPATAPAQPVDVGWTGKLRVVALEGADAPRPAPGSLNIRMSSDDVTPVVLNHQGMDLRCAAFDYRSGNDSLAVMSSKALPVIEMKLSSGTKIRTPSIIYTGADSNATLRGRSTAEIPLPAEGERPAEKLAATWERTAVLTLVPGPEGARDLRADRALFEGEVHVEHPQLALRSDALELKFDPAERSEQPTPKEVKANGAVQCKVVDSSGNSQRINCDGLTVAVAPGADGKPVPKTFVADGNVVATNEDAELRAGHLTVALAPSKAVQGNKVDQADNAKPRAAAAGVWGGGDFEIDSIIAQQEVRLTTREGRTAAAEQVHVTMTPEGTTAELLGQPATLGDGTNTLTGPHIKYEQATQRANVQGPGTLAMVVRDAPDKPARPVTASWESGLMYEGAANRADLTGNASVAAPAPDGSKQLATSDRIIVTFADAPARPTTAAAHAEAADKPRADYFDLAGDKALRSVTLTGNAQVQSTLDGEQEDQLRRIHLLAPEVRYDVASRRAEVPSAGRMLVQDTLPARQNQTGNRMLGNFRGATAFQWEKNLVFDEAANRITMSGSVLIVHEDSERAQQSFRMEANEVRADLIDDRTSTAPPREANAAGALFGPSELHLKSLGATGDIRLSSSQIQIDAQDIVYDAQSDLLTARGTEREPVQVYNDQGVSRGSFAEVVWDARSEQIQRMREVRADVRR